MRDGSTKSWRRDPAALLPVAMSLTALLVVCAHFALVGNLHETDEGTAAHIFQLLMGGQLPVIGYFAVTRLSRSRAYVMRVLVLQLAAAIPVLAIVYRFT